ncbi:kinase-like domain-containing protein [Fimicolochytrium jonesii]|uniref:kinase-like domain-containing protein n=1 Tax=Fimicolochytrium jonesii TaxID=1396493 RepID=UPI0022FE2BEB|nr:kinase-like domain-containing protein [Fimicolochytrium jonesii]KAI8818066.1 kinase-like domain-containing protein [Fimicolochytrium jonesii]
MDLYWPERRVGNEDNVWLGINKQTGEPVAMKLFEREQFADGPVRDEKVVAEVEIIKDLSRQYPARIIQYLDFYSNDENQLVLIMERAECTVQDLLDEYHHLPEFAAREVVFGMLESVACVHTASLVHRDIKPSNLMLMTRTDLTSLKLGDFGVTVGNVGYNNLNQIAGTQGFQAPEMLSRTFYGRPVDLWSCGVTAYLLLYGRLPFIATAGGGMLRTKKIGTKQQLDAIKKGYTFPDDIQVSEDAKNLIASLLQVDPERRPAITDAINHRWFAEAAMSEPIPRPLAQQPSQTRAAPPPPPPRKHDPSGTPEMRRSLDSGVSNNSSLHHLPRGGLANTSAISLESSKSSDKRVRFGEVSQIFRPDTDAEPESPNVDNFDMSGPSQLGQLDFLSADEDASAYYLDSASPRPSDVSSNAPLQPPRPAASTAPIPPFRAEQTEPRQIKRKTSDAILKMYGETAAAFSSQKSSHVDKGGKGFMGRLNTVAKNKLKKLAGQARDSEGSYERVQQSPQPSSVQHYQQQQQQHHQQQQIPTKQPSISHHQRSSSLADATPQPTPAPRPLSHQPPRHAHIPPAVEPKHLPTTTPPTPPPRKRPQPATPDTTTQNTNSFEPSPPWSKPSTPSKPQPAATPLPMLDLGDPFRDAKVVKDCADAVAGSGGGDGGVEEQKGGVRSLAARFEKVAV